MAAGQGFKTFVTGEVLTSGDVNGYLMQGINVFTNATARDAAITAPAEGQFAFTKDNNSLWYYDGAAWVASGATGDIEGVTAGVGISGGGTSGTVTVTNSMATAIDAKGDLVPGTGADTFARLAVGADGTVLTADSAETTGLKWATAAGGGSNYSLLNAGGTTLTSTTTTVSGISGMEKLMIIIGQASANAAPTYTLRFNSDSGSNYYSAGLTTSSSASYSATGIFQQFANQSGGTSINMGNGVGASDEMSGSIFVTGASTTGGKSYQVLYGFDTSTSGLITRQHQGIYLGSAAITSVSLIVSGGSFDGGKIFVYGSAK